MSTDPDKQLSPKVIAGGVAGAITIIIAWVAKDFGGVTIPTEVGMAFTLVLASFAAWLKTDPLRRNRGKHAE